MVKQRILCFVSGILVLACLLACGGIRQAAGRQQAAKDLNQLARMYHDFHESKSKGPANTQELIQFVKNDPAATALATQTGPGGKYVLYWNVRITTLTAGSAATVLGYEASVPASGGMVLMADGSTRTMTAAEFAAAPKPPTPK
jgi:hypothetical protein